MLSLHFLMGLAGTSALTTIANDLKTWGWLLGIAMLVFAGIMWIVASGMSHSGHAAHGLVIAAKVIGGIALIFSAASIAAIGKGLH